MNTRQLKQDVYEGNMALVNYQLVILTWGNVSAIDRETGIIAIKPRGVAYSLLKPDDMSIVDIDGNESAENKYLPSVDLDIHLEIYRNFPDVKAIAHTHSSYATSWAQTGKNIPVLGTTHADHFFGDIPCTRQLEKAEVASDYEKNIGLAIVDAFKSLDPMQIPGILVAGHGPFTWGDDVSSSVEHSLILEEIAKMAVNTRRVDSSSPVLPDFMLQKHYLRKYGDNAYFYQEIIDD